MANVIWKGPRGKGIPEIKRLLAQGCDINEPPSIGTHRGKTSPILEAIIKNRANIVELLLPHKPDLCKKYSGKNAFQWAVKNKNTKILKLLEA